MTDGLDMSLEDIIKNNKKGGGGSAGRGTSRGRSGSNSGPGPTRRFQNRGSNRTTPYSMGKPVHAPETVWQHDMFIDPVGAAAVVAAQGGGGGGGGRGIETGTKLYISNLDYGVSNEDIKELFSEVGDLKRYSVHYDRSGRSKGTAEVVFSRRSDAAAAVKRYNNVQLDGKPMKIEIVGTNIVTPTLPLATNGIFGNPNILPRGGQGRVRATSRLRGGGGGFGGGSRGAGRGRGRGRGRSDPVSAKDLDAELDKYHSEAMQIN